MPPDAPLPPGDAAGGPGRPGTRRYSDDDILEALRSAAEREGDPLSGGRYDAYVAERGGPSRPRVIQRFGSWSHACSEAGLRLHRTHSSYRAAWTTEQLAEHVATYLDEAGPGGSYAGYDDFQKGSGGAMPSAQTVRNRFGSWKLAKQAALEVQAGRGPDGQAGVTS